MKKVIGQLLLSQNQEAKYLGKSLMVPGFLAFML
jgi:hypothetical protein